MVQGGNRLKPGGEALLRAMKINTVAAEAEFVYTRGRPVKDLQGRGPGHRLIVAAGGAQEFVAADVQDNEVIPDKADSIGAGRQAMVAKFQGNLGEQISLVFLLKGRGIAGGVNQNSQNIMAVGIVDAGRVTQLGASGFSGEIDRIGEHFGCVSGVQDGGLGWRLRQGSERHGDKRKGEKETNRDAAKDVHR